MIAPNIEVMTVDELRASLRQRIDICQQQDREIKRLPMYLSLPNIGDDQQPTIHLFVSSDEIVTTHSWGGYKWLSGYKSKDAYGT